MSVDKSRPEPKLFNFTRIRRAQGLALVLIPALTAFKPKIEAAIIQESKPVPPDEVMHLLDQLYLLGIAGGLILQMVAVLQANQQAELPPNENEKDRSSYNSIARQRLGEALRYCNDATYALMKLTRQRGRLIRPSATRAAAFVAVPICFPAAQHSSTHLEGASIPTTSAAPIAATFGLSVKTRNFDCCGQYPKMIALN